MSTGKALERQGPSGLAEYGDFDLDEMQQEADRLPAGGGNYFKAEEGKNVVRLIPPLKGKKAFVAYHKHWYQMGGERKAIVCAKLQYNQPCPICREGARLQGSGSRQDATLAKAYRPQSAVYINVVDMQNPEKGVQIWQTPPGVFKDIMAAIKLENIRNFADPVKGFNLLFMRHGSGLGTKYKSISFSRNASELPDWEELIANQPDLEAAEAMPTDEEQDAALEGEYVDDRSERGGSSGRGGRGGGSRGGGGRGGGGGGAARGGRRDEPVDAETEDIPF